MALKPENDKLQVTRLERMVSLVSAYVSYNEIAASDLPDLMRSVHSTLEDIETGGASRVTTDMPAVPIEESLTDDVIFCLEDGLPFKSLKRHLRTKYDLTPEAYRQKWGLPQNYPMVAPNYAKQRSALARKSGLGRNRQT